MNHMFNWFGKDHCYLTIFQPNFSAETTTFFNMSTCIFMTSCTYKKVAKLYQQKYFIIVKKKALISHDKNYD